MGKILTILDENVCVCVCDVRWAIFIQNVIAVQNYNHDYKYNMHDGVLSHFIADVLNDYKSLKVSQFRRIKNDARPKKKLWFRGVQTYDQRNKQTKSTG